MMSNVQNHIHTVLLNDKLQRETRAKVNCSYIYVHRCNFNLTKFIVTLNLVIEGASWFSSSLDEDYQLKMANDGAMWTMEKVCADVACTPTDPDMPDTTSMPANCPTSYGADNRPSAVMLMVVFVFLRWLMQAREPQRGR